MKALQNDSKGRSPYRYQIDRASRSLDNLPDEALLPQPFHTNAANPLNGTHLHIRGAQSLPATPALTSPSVPIAQVAKILGSVTRHVAQTGLAKQALSVYVPECHADEPFDESRSADFWYERDRKKGSGEGSRRNSF